MPLNTRIKNNKAKSVELSVEVYKGIANIQVKDTGVGILGNHIGEIFNLFTAPVRRKPVGIWIV